MAPIRVILGTMPVLLADIVRDTLAVHRDEVRILAEVGTRNEIAPAVRRTDAQVAVLAFPHQEWAGLSDFLPTLLADHPRLAVIALASDGRSGFVFSALNDVSPESLVRAIRATGTPGAQDVHPVIHPFSAR